MSTFQESYIDLLMLILPGGDIMPKHELHGRVAGRRVRSNLG